MRDLYHNLLPAQSLAPAARTANTNGSGVDLQGHESALVLIDVGSWTDGTHTFQIEESDDDVAYAAVADADLLGAEPAVTDGNGDNTVYAVGYVGAKRYIRASVTVAGATTGAVYGASVVRGHARHRPVV